MLPDFLNGPGFQLLLFGGKGGVGKTTCAAATALRLADEFPARAYLLVSTDPAHSLADSLAGWPPPSNLSVLEMDARQSLAAFKARHGGKLREIASRGTFLDDEDLRQLLELSLPGLDEVMAFLEIAGWVAEQRYDSVLVDTAPSGHTLRMLQVPQLLHGWLDALDALLAKDRYLRQAFGRSGAADELDVFLDELAASVCRMEELLRDDRRCRFVPVLTAEVLSVRETSAMVRELNGLGLPITALVVNRFNGVCPHLSFPYPVWGVPLYPQEVRGGRALRAFWNGIARLEDTPAEEPPTIDFAPMVETAAEVPSPSTTLVLIGGKGGVGKTTIACATALSIAGEYPGTRVLLFSADPAHSLSHCLDLPIGPEPTPVCPGLSAIEIDARAEFDCWKRQYGEDVERNFDLTFDREAMERIMDLAPPGLDEIMTQSRVMDLLARRACDMVVLDSAATGHMLRWLELPAVVEQWVRVLLGLFLKYERVWRLPRFSEQLLRLSRHVRGLRKLLADPARSQLLIVAIPAEMALAETMDLVSACERMRIRVPAIFLNLMTHPPDRAMREKYRENFPRQRHTMVYRQQTPRGLARLAQLGRALYQPAGKEAVACVS